HLSTLGLCLTGGYRLPISSPGVSLRLGAGADVSFMMQEVRDPYLSSNANAITVGAIGDATLELLPWDHLGLLASVGGYLGTSAGSWDLTDEYGSPRDAEPDEVYFTELRRSPVRFGAGFFYLIY
ncbi:hypothetical protein JW921_03115, partial [Candidatus Fermentibacterales bacterium]|nr:hypothetical protein [Candidatus Fermentibacterales bacterium]